MGGTVRLITNQPDLKDYHASFQSIDSGTEGGGFNHNENFALNLPLVRDKLALRVVGSEGYTSGWIDRVVVRGNVAAAPVAKRYSGVNDSQLYGVRLSLLWKPTERLSITPGFLYQTTKQNGSSA